MVITLDAPPENLRPGLSATAKITTGFEKSTVSIPIQALIMRDKNDLEAQAKKGPGKKDVAAPMQKKESQEIQGVFVVTPGKKAEFRQVETGLTGTTEIQIKSGLKENEEIITGSFKVLKTLKNGAGVKVDNTLAVKTES